MIVVTVILALLAILGAPLFAVIATSAMLGFHRDETDLMNIALEILSIAASSCRTRARRAGAP